MPQTQTVQSKTKISDIDAKLNRLKSQKAALETKQKVQTKRERMQRTRTLIQVGGLVSLSGLLERFGIALGDDLQLDIDAKEQSKVIMGVLMSVMEQLPRHLSENELQRLSKKGERALTTRAIQKDINE
jgi:hypothetical protein